MAQKINASKSYQLNSHSIYDIDERWGCTSRRQLSALIWRLYTSLQI